MEAHLALHFAHRSRFRVDVHQHVMSLAVLVDTVGGVAKAPAFDLGHLAAICFDHALELFRKGFGLLPGNILASEEYMLVEGHEAFPFLCQAGRAKPPCRFSAPRCGPGKAKGNG
jgi:hypothetical protein